MPELFRQYVQVRGHNGDAKFNWDGESFVMEYANNINGFKPPSPECEQEIMHCIEKLGNEYLTIANQATKQFHCKSNYILN